MSLDILVSPDFVFVVGRKTKEGRSASTGYRGMFSAAALVGGLFPTQH